MDIAHDRRLNRERGQAAARIALAVALLALGLYILQGFLRALVWAVILAVAAAPLYGKLSRRFPARRANVVLPLLFTLGTTLLFLVPLALILFQVAQEGQVAARWLADLRQNGAAAPEWLGHLPVLRGPAQAWWQANLADPEGARALIGRFEQGGTLQLGRELGTAAVHRAVLFGFTLLTLFFLFRDGPRLTAQLLATSRRLFGPEGEPVARQMVASIHGTVDGLVLVGLGEGAVLGVGYALAGAPHPALLGAATAVAAIIPMGAPIVLVIAGLLVLAGGKTVTAAVLVGVGMALIFVADHAIRPTLIGGATRLPFLWVLLGILGGVETFGLLGLFLGPAVMAALILLWREWTNTLHARLE